MCIIINGNRGFRYIPYKFNSKQGLIGLKRVQLHEEGGRCWLGGAYYTEYTYPLKKLDDGNILVLPDDNLQNITINIPVVQHTAHGIKFQNRCAVSHFKMGAHISPVYYHEDKEKNFMLESFLDIHPIMFQGRVVKACVFPVYFRYRDVQLIGVDSSVVVKAFYLLKPARVSRIISYMIQNYPVSESERRILSECPDKYRKTYKILLSIPEEE